jgi:hypothetical protein
MQPFKISERSVALVEVYPPANQLGLSLKMMREDELEGLVRLWVSEGIPYAFRQLPILYELVRAYLGNQLGVHPKFITLVGSARMGYSMAPAPEFGRAYGTHSDLDFAIVSESLFARFAAAFYQWKADFADGRVKPLTGAEGRFWPANLARVPETLRRGFIDEQVVPRRNLYPLAQKTGQALYLVERKLSITSGAPSAQKCSLRIFQDWKSFIGQMKLNLGYRPKKTATS